MTLFKKYQSSCYCLNLRKALDMEWQIIEVYADARGMRCSSTVLLNGEKLTHTPVFQCQILSFYRCIASELQRTTLSFYECASLLTTATVVAVIKSVQNKFGTTEIARIDLFAHYAVPQRPELAKQSKDSFFTFVNYQMSRDVVCIGMPCMKLKCQLLW